MMADYPLPAGDPPEIERLNGQHQLIREAKGKLHYAPLRNPRWILDVASGTGIWADEMAQRFARSAIVIGLDKNAEYDAYARAHRHHPFAANYLFVRADCLHPFPFAANQFDYTHSRLVAPFLPWSSWPAYLAEMARVTRPGGWVECVESPLPQCEGPGYQAMCRAAEAISQQVTGGYNPAPHLLTWMQQAGLAQVQEQVLEIGAGDPADPQVARFQRLIKEDMDVGFSWSLAPAILKFGLMTKDELDRHVQAMREEFKTLPITWTVHIVWGQKPRKVDG